MNLRRGLRVAGSLLLFGAIVVPGIGVADAPARAATPLIGWTAVADGNPVDIVVDNASGLGGAHPLSEADVPEDTSDFETGPFGHALASVAWPGAAAGNVGSLSGELPVPSQFAALLANDNDPVRAESFYPTGPASATYPAGSSGGAVEMRSAAGDHGVSATAAVSDMTVAGLVDIKDVFGSSSASADTTATSTASSSFSGLSLLGGLVQIGASSSTATASSDGVHVSGSGSTHVGAITVGGHAASVGSDGLVIGSPISGLGGLTAVPTAVLDKVLAAIDLKVATLPQVETSKAPTEKVTSGGLQISLTAPSTLPSSINCGPVATQLSALCTLPGLLQGGTFTMTVARVSATAIAAPDFGTPPAAPASPTATPTPATAGGDTPLGIAQPQIPALASGPSPQPGLGPAVPSLASPPATFVPLRPASLSRPVHAGLIALVGAVAALAGWALFALTKPLERPPPDACPLEELT